MQGKDISIIVGKQISKIWCGYAAFLFVELGPLFTVVMTSKKGNYPSEKGEYTIMIDGNWSIYKDAKQVVDGLESSYADIDACIKNLVGSSIRSIDKNLTENKVSFHMNGGYVLETHKRDDWWLTVFRNEGETGIVVFGL